MSIERDDRLNAAARHRSTNTRVKQFHRAINI
nr:MAG TPA_asm: hypothetical protein [Microviridae sp.]